MTTRKKSRRSRAQDTQRTLSAGFRILEIEKALEALLVLSKRDGECIERAATHLARMEFAPLFSALMHEIDDIASIRRRAVDLHLRSSVR